MKPYLKSALMGAACFGAALIFALAVSLMPRDAFLTIFFAGWAFLLSIAAAILALFACIEWTTD